AAATRAATDSFRKRFMATSRGRSPDTGSTHLLFSVLGLGEEGLLPTHAPLCASRTASLRALICDVPHLDEAARIDVVIRQPSALAARKHQRAQHRYGTARDIVELVREFVRTGRGN